MTPVTKIEEMKLRADGYYVYTWGGDRYTPVAWFKTRTEAEKDIERRGQGLCWPVIELKPATPLPWEHDSDTPSRNGSPRAMVFPVDDDIDNPTVVAGGIKPENAAYIVHAANAYHRLVSDRARLIEALRPMIEGTAFITDAQVETARALLRELGEHAD